MITDQNFNCLSLDHYIYYNNKKTHNQEEKK